MVRLMWANVHRVLSGVSGATWTLYLICMWAEVPYLLQHSPSVSRSIDFTVY